MKKEIRIEFDKKWLYERRRDPVPTYILLQRGLREAFEKDIKVHKVAINVFQVIVDCDDETEAERIVSCLTETIRDAYQLNPGESPEVSISLSDIPERNAEDEASRKPNKVCDSLIEDRLKEIDKLTGADEFKALAHEIALVGPRLKGKEKEVFYSRTYLFSINDGCGLTTYLDELKLLLILTGLNDSGKDLQVEEYRLPQPKEGRSIDPPDLYDAIRNRILDARTAVLCLDISEWMNKLGTHEFKTLLEHLDVDGQHVVLVFRVPFIDKEVLEKVRAQLSDLMTVRVVSFPPFSNRELEDCAKEELLKYGMEMEESAVPLFTARMTEEKSDGHFYGLRTMQRVVKELVYNKHLSNAQTGNMSKIITREDAGKIRLYENIGDRSADEMLNGLVGSEAIRSRIEEIVSQIQLAKKEPGLESPCIHMRFVGNPGTGKTTVARIIGKMLKEKGVLRVGDFFEYSGRDFCGRYVGETAPKTSSMCRDAYGSVLFIDEAYSLCRSTGDRVDFGREALDTLIAEMENHRSDLVVIMAGYTDEMETLMKGNPGLSSRMPYVIEFPNFTREQLYQIYESMAGMRFECSNDLFPAVRSFFEKIPDSTIQSKEFSNGRFVRNLFERTWAKASLRSQLNKEARVVLTKEDFDRSVQEKEFALNEKGKGLQIGFV